MSDEFREVKLLERLFPICWKEAKESLRKIKQLEGKETLQEVGNCKMNLIR